MPVKNQPLFPLVLLFAVVVLVGCGEEGPPRYRVTGTVTFNAQPIEEGVVVVADVNRQQSPEGAKIENGKFHMLLTEGEKRIEIDASREVPGETPPLSESYIPRKFNRESELTFTVEPNNGNSPNFDLEN